MMFGNEMLINTMLGVMGFVLSVLIAMTAYFLVRLISQLDRTTNTVQDLSKSFEIIAVSFKRYELDHHKSGAEIAALQSDVAMIKVHLALD